MRQLRKCKEYKLPLCQRLNTYGLSGKLVQYYQKVYALSENVQNLTDGSDTHTR